MLKVTGFVMKTAPVAIFAALASTVATQGPGVLVTYAGFVSGFYLSLGALWLVLFLAALAIIGTRAFGLFRSIRTPVLLAFSRSEEHTSELQSLMRISYAVFYLKKTKKNNRESTEVLH